MYLLLFCGTRGNIDVGLLVSLKEQEDGINLE